MSAELLPILQVRDLSTGFRTDRGSITAVDRVSFDLYPGEVLGIVGESGCGKSVTTRTLMRLLPDTAFLTAESRILFDGIDLARADEKVMRTIRGNRIGMIFQEPMTALNPVFTIGWQIDEALRYHTGLDRAARRRRVTELLELVEIPNPERRIDEYPHQLSGGMRQRVVIAMALACEPEILVADDGSGATTRDAIAACAVVFPHNLLHLAPRHQRQRVEQATRVSVRRVHQVLVQAVARRQRAVQVQSVARALAELLPVRRRQQPQREASGRKRRKGGIHSDSGPGGPAGSAEPAHQLEAGGDVAPLVPAAHLHHAPAVSYTHLTLPTNREV